MIKLHHCLYFSHKQRNKAVNIPIIQHLYGQNTFPSQSIVRASTHVPAEIVVASHIKEYYGEMLMEFRQGWCVAASTEGNAFCVPF